MGRERIAERVSSYEARLMRETMAMAIKMPLSVSLAVVLNLFE